MSKFSNEYYAIEYELVGEPKFAVYFQLESAQEAMMKMIKMGTVVKGMETKRLK
jgi:hypothetical protein